MVKTVIVVHQISEKPSAIMYDSTLGVKPNRVFQTNLRQMSLSLKAANLHQ